MASTLRQKVLQFIYPLLIWSKQKTSKEGGIYNRENVPPSASFHSLSAVLLNGKEFSFEKLKGKKVLLVNTASNCGYTPQYAELQKLYQHHGEDLEIIGFPSNDFKEQEAGTNAEIASFCSKNYGVSFPITKKTVVIKNAEQHAVYQWLTNKKLNGWNDQQPSWNFSKYLVNEEGVLSHYFPPQTSPLSPDVLQIIN